MGARPKKKKAVLPPSSFITGYPGFIGRRLVEHMVKAEPRGHITLLVQPKFVKQAKAEVAKLGVDTVTVLSGDIVDMHLGLSGDEYRQVTQETTHIFHLAAISYLGAPTATFRRVNVEGTRNVLELAKDCERLERLSHFSTCYVSGDRIGVIAEDELDVGQTFHNAYESTKYEAEKLVVRAKDSLPVTIFRPSSVVGDSRTGEIDRFEGPYALAILMVMSPLVVPLPLPGDGVAPLNVVPVDFVVRAVWQLARDPRAAGKTFHLVDPNPLSARRAYELIAKRSNKRLPKFTVSAKAAEAVLRLPWLEKLLRPQRAAIHYVNQLAFYSCSNTLALLEGSGIQCPPLHTYLDKLIDYVREYYRKRREESEVEDPLDLS